MLTVSSSNIDSLVQGKLELDVSGKNIIANSATFEAINNSTNNIDVKTVSGAVLNIAVQKLISNMDTNTVLNIGGELDAKNVTISTDTERYSKVDYSSQGYGGVSIGYTNVRNNVKGSSILNLDGYTSNSEKAGTITVNHKSKNTHDSVSNSVSGGLVAVDSMDVEGEFNTSTVMNVKNSDINTNGNISFNVENTNVIEDSSKSTSGGVISLSKNVTSHTYNSGSELNIENSNIKSAKNIDLTTFASTKNGDGNYIDYAGKGGGFVASVTVELTNNVNQNSKINIKNSKIRADKNLVATAKTGSAIRQQIQTKAGGFIAIPKNINTLNVINNDEINVYGNSSEMNAGSNLVLNLDSNNDLGVRSESKASSFGFKDPVAKSYLNFTVNNKLNNNGSISGDEYVDINLMGSSVNNLNQYAHSESKAAVATSTEDGRILKQINNNITVGDGGEISTGKNMEITYSVGKGVTNSEISWKNTSYALFGIPITTSGRKSNVTSNNNATMNLNGSGNINAGRRNSKYMKVNADGTIDSSTRGFENSEYVVTSGEALTADEMKAQTINNIQVNIDEIDSTIQNIDNQTPELTAQKNSASGVAESHRNELNTLKEYVDNEYEIVDETGLNSAIVGKIIGDRGNDADDTTILNAYKTEIENVDARNTAKYEANANSTSDYTLESDPTFVEFLDKYTFEQFVTDSGKVFEGETQEDIDQAKQLAQEDFNTRISQLKSSFNSEKTNLTRVNSKYEYKEYKYTVSDGSATQEFKYIVASRSDAYSILEADQAELDNKVASIEKQLNSNAQLKADMLAEKSIYQERLTEAQNRDYTGVAGGEAIVFSPVKTNVSTIRIDGIDISNINSMDKFKTTPAGMEIENYSMKSLIFNDIDLSTQGVSKLYINGQEQTITSMVDKATSITINNHYDASNPFVTSGIVPSIDFNGHIKANSDSELFVRAESGNINLVNKTGMDITSSKTQLLALQGDVNVLFDSDSNPKFNLRSQDEIFAGNDINISAREVQIEGKLTAGLADRNVTITDDMLSNLTVDPLTGETNLVNLGGNPISPYFNEKNNIKAIYKDGKIYLFDVKQSNGNINISANSSSVSGAVKQHTGFRNINITNNTNKEIVVGDILNVTNDSVKLPVIGNVVELSNAKVTNGNQAIISIVSDGKVTSNRVIKNGLHNGEFVELEDLNGAKLSIDSKKGVDILAFNSQYVGEIAETVGINTIGDVTITNDVGGVKIETAVNTKNGIINVSNNTDGIKIAGDINTENGVITVANQTGGVKVTGSVNTSDGDIAVSNQDGGVEINNTVTTGNGKIELSNQTGGVKISGDISTENGIITVSNKTGGIKVTGAVNTADGDITVSNQDGGVEINNTVTTGNGKIELSNKTGGMKIAGDINTENGIITVSNKTGGVSVTGAVNTTDGDITISNQDGGIEIKNTVTTGNGKIGISNKTGGVRIEDAVKTENGDISISNQADGIQIFHELKTDSGDIDITNNSGDIVIGKNIDAVETFVETKEGNITVTQSNGNILNGVVDNSTKNHSTDDINNPNKAYKTLIATTGDLTIAVTDGDIGSTSHENAGVSINADTRDYTDSLNVNVSGNIKATSLNSSKSDERLINIRAKQSDMNITNVNADGNVILTAVDTDSENNGYKVVNTLEEQGTNVRGQNVSIIASDTIGSADKALYVESISDGTDGKYSASLYAKNDINLEIETDAKTGVQFHQILSKQGDLNIGLSENTMISELVSTKGINVVQRAQNLTIYSIGKLIAEDSPYATMDDIFASKTVSESNPWTPEYVNIKVLDAVDTAERSESNLKIYTAWVKGNQDNVYPDGTRLADVTLMADNVWAGSDKAPNSLVETPRSPHNEYTQKTYSNELTGTQNPKTLKAEGFNAYGDGKELTFDVVGVSSDAVESAGAQRDNYSELKTFDYVSPEFANPNAPKGLSNTHANNVILSVNDYAKTNRGVVVDSLYANKAYVDTNDINFTLNDGQINHYGQIQNGGAYKTAVAVDNDYRRIIQNADVQLFTAKTGSFNLKLGNSINSTTSGPAVYYNPHRLVNGYHSSYNFVEDAYKMDVINQKNIPIHKSMQQRVIQRNEAQPRKEVFVTDNNLNNQSGVSSDVKIYNISTSSALVENGKNFKRGNKVDFKLTIDGEDTYVKAKVIEVRDGKAQLEFINLPDSTANKLRYKYMQADSEGEKLSNIND